MAWFKSDGSALPYKAMTYKGVYAYIPKSDAGDYAYNPVIVFSVNGNEFRQYPLSRSSTADMDTYYYGDITVPVVTGSDGRFRCRFWLEVYPPITSVPAQQTLDFTVKISDFVGSDGRFRCRFWLEVYPPITSVPAQQTLDFTVKISDFVKLDKPIYDSSTEQLLDKQNGLIQEQINQDNNFHDQDKNDATNAGSDMQGMATDLETVTEQLLDKQNGLIQEQINQDNNFHDQDKNDATNAGSDMQGMATDLETVKSKWEILWYPLIQEQINQDNNFHDQDKNDATNAGSDMQGMATDLETVKSKWEILWYPIEFTNRVMGAFQGSSSARYASAYADVSGYRYDEDSGLLEPIVLNTRSSAGLRANSGTMIHIPAYTLPVLDVQVWEGADYDLSSLKEQFPDAFNLLYVVVTVLEVMWFVSFLRDKYEEVFG